ncbi:LCP family protein [Streptomyces sp. PmtG]
MRGTRTPQWAEPAAPPPVADGYETPYGQPHDHGAQHSYDPLHESIADHQANSGNGYAHGPSSGRDPRAAPVNWRRRAAIAMLAFVILLLTVLTGTYFWADANIRREIDLSKVQDRPAGGAGTNYLIVGSDSREGLSDDEKDELRTGSVTGKRADSMMLLHTGDNGSALVSLPRDSWVTIPSFKGSESGRQFPARGSSKLNAAYAIDGPELLVRTVEYNTGLRIDHYAEIGFSGFANVVDTVGGVDIDIPRDTKDVKSGADFTKGRQTLNGQEALAFVRTRYALPGSDLDRTNNQRKFLAALVSQTATSSIVLNPFKLYPAMGAGLNALTVDKGMTLGDLASMFWAVRDVTGGDGASLNIPIAGNAPQGSLEWDTPKVKRLFDELKKDKKVTLAEQ